LKNSLLYRWRDPPAFFEHAGPCDGRFEKWQGSEARDGREPEKPHMRNFSTTC
jgi:hypothetical protein